MEKSPEVIIAEFEQRRTSERIARRKRFFRRTFDVAQLALALIVACVLVIRGETPANKPYLLFVGVMLFSFLSGEVQKRWTLEDRVAELERKKPDELRS
jgi:hypothetical protein